MCRTHLGVRGVETGLLVEESGKVKEKMELWPDRLGDTELRIRSKHHKELRMCSKYHKELRNAHVL